MLCSICSACYSTCRWYLTYECATQMRFSHPLMHLCMQAEVRTLERVSERIKDGIRDIDARATRISQTATRVGDRLQVSATMSPTISNPVPAAAAAAAMMAARSSECSLVQRLRLRAWCVAQITAGTATMQRSAVHMPFRTLYLAPSYPLCCQQLLHLSCNI
jgi:hypothetical protein